MEVLVPEFNGVNFNDKDHALKLHELSQHWQTIRANNASAYPRLMEDPYLSPTSPQDQEALLKRFLLAEEYNVPKAADRLRATLLFRKRFNMLQFYLPGSGAKTLSERLNPGAEAYFVDSCCVDKEGAPVLIGKVKLCSNDNMHSWAHLRAALFICERIAAKCVHPIQQASYLLDTSPCTKDFVGTYGPLGGDTKSKHYNKYNRTKEENAATDIGRFVTSEDPSTIPSEEINALLKQYGEATPGLKVLKIAMLVLQEYYPESLKRVVFVHSDISFWLLFKIFSLWAQKRTRKKFMFIGNGWKDYPMSSLEEWMDKDQIYKDFGGDGPAMGGDDFVKRAVAMYDGIESVGAACGGGEGERKEQVDEKKSTSSSSSVAVEIKDVAGKDGFKILDV
jgi:hypothetical protein